MISTSSLFRLAGLVTFVACVSLLGYGYWLQYREFLDPCPLCIFQRIAFTFLGLIALIGTIHNPIGYGRRIYAALSALAGILGAAVAGRHIYLQNLPADQIPECGPGLEFMLSNMPLADALQKALAGSGECANISWTFLGLSMPWWTLFWYLVLSALMVTAAQRRS